MEKKSGRIVDDDEAGGCTVIDSGLAWSAALPAPATSAVEAEANIEFNNAMPEVLGVDKGGFASGGEVKVAS